MKLQFFEMHIENIRSKLSQKTVLLEGSRLKEIHDNQSSQRLSHKFQNCNVNFAFLILKYPYRYLTKSGPKFRIRKKCETSFKRMTPSIGHRSNLSSHGWNIVFRKYFFCLRHAAGGTLTRFVKKE